MKQQYTHESSSYEDEFVEKPPPKSKGGQKKLIRIPDEADDI